jgi:hypothetical protein
VGLPHIRWITTEQAAGQDDVRIAASAAGDRRVADVYARLGGSEVVEEYVERGPL